MVSNGEQDCIFFISHFAVCLSYYTSEGVYVIFYEITCYRVCCLLTKFSSHSSLNCWNFWDIRSWALPTALLIFSRTTYRQSLDYLYMLTGALLRHTTLRALITEDSSMCWCVVSGKLLAKVFGFKSRIHLTRHKFSLTAKCFFNLSSKLLIHFSWKFGTEKWKRANTSVCFVQDNSVCDEEDVTMHCIITDYDTQDTVKIWRADTVWL